MATTTVFFHKYSFLQQSHGKGKPQALAKTRMKFSSPDPTQQAPELTSGYQF